MGRCAQEMCTNWSGDGDVCPCALFDLDRPHTLTEYGTTNCPVEQVRANVDDGECSACGAAVSS